MADFMDRMYQELRIVQERRLRLQTLMITAVAALFAIPLFQRKPDPWHMTPCIEVLAFHLVPAVMVILDVMSMKSTINIKRITTFLAVYGDSFDKEGLWRSFPPALGSPSASRLPNRSPQDWAVWFHGGLIMVIIAVAGIAAWCYPSWVEAKKPLSNYELWTLLWFIGLAAFWLVAKRYEIRRKRSFDIWLDVSRSGQEGIMTGFYSGRNRETHQ